MPLTKDSCSPKCFYNIQLPKVTDSEGLEPQVFISGSGIYQSYLKVQTILSGVTYKGEDIEEIRPHASQTVYQ